MGLPRRLASLAENLLVQLHPLVVLVEGDARVDELERQLVERRVDFPVRRHEVALREDLLAFLADLEVVEQHRGVRMRGAARDADPVRPRDRRADREPVDRRALALELFGLVIVYGQRERHLARHDELREQRVALAHRHAVSCDDLLEEFRALGLADLVEHAREPIRVLLLDAESAFPLRVEQIFPCLRQLLLFHGFGVVGLNEHVQARPTHSPWGRIAGAIRSAWCGDLTCCRTFSRCSDSISGPLVSTMSTVLRLARASATARCSTFSELARHTLTFTAYFFS